MICPNLSNPQIKQEFDELKSVLGDDLAYLIWDRNNGYHLDKAPNGQVSKLFNNLLTLTDRKQAIETKAKTLSQSFNLNYKGSFDINNEPTLNLGDAGFVSEEESIKKENRQQTQIYGSIAEAILSDFKTYFPDYDHFNDEQRAVVAKSVEDGKLQLTCKF